MNYCSPFFEKKKDSNWSVVATLQASPVSFTARWLHILRTASRCSISKLLCSRKHISPSARRRRRLKLFIWKPQPSAGSKTAGKATLFLADFSIQNCIILHSHPCFIRARPPQVLCIAAALKLLPCLAQGPCVNDADMAVTDAYQEGLHFPTGTRKWTSNVPCHPQSLPAG